jgi:hypothetical protein
MSVFFHSLHVSKQNKVTVICSDVPTSDSMFEMDIDGLEFGMAATPQAVQYGVLAFRDTKTKKPVDARTWDGLALLRTWQRGKGNWHGLGRTGQGSYLRGGGTVVLLTLKPYGGLRLPFTQTCSNVWRCQLPC